MKNKVLFDYCRWNKPDKVKELLEESGDSIDITYKDGIFFRLAVSEPSAELLDVLLGYYEKTKLADDTSTDKSTDYIASKRKISQILQDAVETYGSSDEIQERLSSYLPPRSSDKEKDSDDEHNLDGFDSADFGLDEDGNPTDLDGPQDPSTLGDSDLSSSESSLIPDQNSDSDLSDLESQKKMTGDSDLSSSESSIISDQGSGSSLSDPEIHKKESSSGLVGDTQVVESEE